MESISLLARPDDFPLLALVIFAPLFGAFFNGVFGKRLGKPAVRIMALASTLVSFLAAVVTFLRLHELHHHAEVAAEKALAAVHAAAASAHGAAHAPPAAHAVEFAPVKLSWLAWHWMSMAAPDSNGRIPIDVKYSVDELSGVMMLVITGVGFLIHLYSTSYMAKDPGYHRFFAYLNLFLFSMLTLVLADNMPLMFVGWEGVGACSYLLIGFWFTQEANASAGRKAFIANRIGDVGIIVGMLFLAYFTGALDWEGINKGASRLLDLDARVTLFTYGHFVLSASAATVACLALFLGCTGKSAQLPLYVWLPDAMAGPTPVSALIHAATMVTSGLYLICRLNVVFSLSPFAMMVIAVVGALTALLAATIALVQNDIKKVLAYSTVSQLGFMFLGVGVGAFSMGFFHVFTHAFFKACLFLGAGSVIHAMHARVHDDQKSQDMREMGGLRRYMPWTFASMAAATLAIAGCPLTSGFFSKDGLLFKAAVHQVLHPWVATARDSLVESCQPGAPALAACKEFERVAHAPYFAWPTWLGPTLFVVGILTATLTAFYMFRLLFKTFYGEFRGWAVDPQAALATNPFDNEETLVDDADHGVPASGHDDPHGHLVAHASDEHGHAAHGHDAHGHDGHDAHDAHDAHHHEDLTSPADPPAEAPWTMAVPVAILAAFSLFAGFLYAEPLANLFHAPSLEVLGHFLAPVFSEVVGHSVKIRAGLEWLEGPLVIPGVLAFAVGLGLAYWMYVLGEGRLPRSLAERFPRVYRAAYDKWYVDEAYQATILGGTDTLAEGSALTDKWLVDGVVARLPAMLSAALGSVLRATQTGVVQVYGMVLAVGAVGIALFFVQPHVDATIRNTGDSFVIEAAPGLGYEYKWDLGSGAMAGFESGDSALSRTVTVAKDKTVKVTLEVRNAFGRTARRTFDLVQPKPPAQPAVQAQR